MKPAWNLIREEVNMRFDVDIHRENEELVEERRAKLLEAMREPTWAAAVLAKLP
jgi:hypothetical protein